MRLRRLTLQSASSVKCTENRDNNNPGEKRHVDHEGWDHTRGRSARLHQLHGSPRVGGRPSAKESEAKADTITKAVAILIPTKGSKAEGRVTFTERDGTVHVHAEISGLAPGDHGFHIHEFGVWSEDGMASGGHYNPTHEMHAGTDTPKRHVGDLGNITANANGNATLDLDDSSLRFRGPTSIIGRGLVVHEKADDLKTQPTGNAGGRGRRRHWRGQALSEESSCSGNRLPRGFNRPDRESTVTSKL